MARIRSIHPDTCVSETLARLSAELERTFTRLWTHCDDAGRCVDNVRLIKAALYPLHDHVTVIVLDAELDELQRAGLVQRYVVDGKRFLAVNETSWREYQHPNRPVPSKLPAPPEGHHLPPTDLAVSTHAQHSEPPRTPHEQHTPVVGEGEGDVEGEGVSRSTALELVAPPLPERPSGGGFERFWSVYPRKVGKGSAAKAWDKAMKRAMAKQIIVAAAEQADAFSRAGTEHQFIPHPATWLNRDGWLDELAKPVSPVNGTPHLNNGSQALARAYDRIHGGTQ